MEKDDYTTEVVFRKYKPSHNFGRKGVIVALFPYDIADFSGSVLCYEYCGQHGGANYQHVVHTMTTPATEEEYKELKTHLEEHYGYNFKVIKKINHDKYLKAYKEMKK
jgi:hypothetical protein